MPCKALQQNKSSIIGLCRSQPFTLSHKTGNGKLFAICVTLTSSHMYDNCARKEEGVCVCIERERGREGGGRTILAGLHGKLGPTGAAVPGENPFTGYLLASTMLFITRGAIKIIINAIFFSCWRLTGVLSSTHSALKPLTCRILICFTMVLFPDSPAPSKIHTNTSQNDHKHGHPD